ncbi:MAG: znuB [Gammaproteobacteria bacterium]|jgi:zinc/manganese transport system ATP-binding protein|nr:znuB [Gammaproteobacteria bacterium]
MPITPPVNAITAKGLSLAYGQQTILHDFSAQIQHGEFIGVFGPNGAGKSTLLKAILGLIKPSQGELLILDKPVKRGNICIGYLPQMRSQLPHTQFNGRAIISSAKLGYRWGMPRLSQAQQQEITRVIELVEAQDYVDRPFYQLSGGERQRLLLGQALLDNPQILLLDEPLANLDPRYQESLLDLVQRLQRQLKMTVLFTAHDVNPLLGVMNRVLYLARGNAALGTVQQVITSEQLSALYQAPIDVIQYQQRLFVISKERGIIDYGAHCCPHSEHV